MTNGPGAMVAEIVENPLPKDRARHEVHKHPHYYALRNHLIDFLVTRSKTFRDEVPEGYDRRKPPLVRPAAQPLPVPPTQARSLAARPPESIEIDKISEGDEP